MTSLNEIWNCIKKYMPKEKWTQLQEIYEIVEKNIKLDNEDFNWQSPTSPVPKWKRNVRSVLQKKKINGEIEWKNRGYYRL